MKSTKILRYSLAFLAAAFLTVLSACEIPYINWSIGKKIAIRSQSDIMEDEEVRLIALYYKCEFDGYYNEIYGQSFWHQAVSENMDFESYVKEYYIYEECKALLILEEAAAEDGVYLTQEENETISEQAAACYDRMTECEREYTGAKESHIRKVLSRYRLAEKEIKYLTASADTDVSDEESRVADVQIIRLSERQDAEEALERLNNGENFSSVAKQISLDQGIDYTAEKGQLIDELDEAAFSLSEGETSGIIEAEDRYFIIHLSKYYDTLLSRNHKQNMLAERKFDAWRSVYDEKEADGSVSRNSSLFDAISLDAEGDFTDVGLFSETDE